MPSGVLFIEGQQNQVKFDLSSLVEWEVQDLAPSGCRKLPDKLLLGLKIFSLPSFHWRDGRFYSFHRYLLNI